MSGADCSSGFREERFDKPILESILQSECSALVVEVDKLFDKFGAEFQDLDLKFPEIVVVGTESVGKSSLLEKIAGFPIFPRGEEITTRFPFRLRLHHCSQVTMQSKIRSIPAEQIYHFWDFPILIKFENDSEYLANPDAVRRRLKSENEKVRIAGLGFSRSELILNMYGVMFPNLTILDTPGLISVKGFGEPEDIVERCRSIVTERVKNEDSIVLAVLNARNSIRGTAAGIQIIQQLQAENRTVAVLTNIDRTGKDEEIPEIMRQAPHLGLPALKEHFHAVIGRDIKRTFNLQRAEREHIAQFEEALKAMNVSAVEALLTAGLISEEALDAALGRLLPTNQGDKAKQLCDMISKCLDHTRAEQEKFEGLYFTPLGPSGLSEWQTDRKVDEGLLSEDLIPYLGSKRLASRLSEMMTKHIGLQWAPKMLQQVKSTKRKLEGSKAACGDKPPADSLSSSAKQFLERVVDEFSRLIAIEASTLEGDIRNHCDSHFGREYSFSRGGTVIQDFKEVRTVAAGIIKDYKSLFKRACIKCLETQLGSVQLHRFQVFHRWMMSVVESVSDEIVVSANKKLESLFGAFEPDNEIITGFKSRNEFEQELTNVVVKLLPRLIHIHVVRVFFEGLKTRILLQPLQYEGVYLLKETEKNAEVRAKLEDKLQYLQSFEKELKKINNTMIKKYSDEAGLYADAQIPSTWVGGIDLDASNLCDVSQSSSEYRDVIEMIRLTISNLSVIRLQRIQSRPLWTSYTARKDVMDQRSGIKSNEKRLFHGTKSFELAQIICERGFNRSYAVTHAYGKGTYFARDASYSAHDTYSPPDPSTGHRYMYLTRVLVGEFCPGKADDKQPQRRRKHATSQHDLCDTTVDNEANPTIFVTYRDDQAYPEYLITFTKI